MMRDTSKLPAAVHVELLASVFAILAPSVIMSLLFACVGAVALARTGDLALAILYAAGLVASGIRLAVTIRLRRRFAAAPPSPAAAWAIERCFGLAYLGFATILGLFAARAAMVGGDRILMLMGVLVTGYAAGVSTGTALRPIISVSAMLLGVGPVLLAAAAGGSIERAALAILFAGFLAGGVRSTIARYRTAVSDIAMRHRFAALARSDPLTGLPNRLALTEHLQAIAVHGDVDLFCIDLDEFKPINDRYGHPVGDDLLRATGVRLRTLLGPQDLAARLGGDEFVIVRRGGGGCVSSGRRGAETFALEIALVLSEPHAIADGQISVGASVGWAPLQPETDPEAAIAAADRDLYRAKRNRIVAPPGTVATADAPVPRLPLRGRPPVIGRHGPG